MKWLRAQEYEYFLIRYCHRFDQNADNIKLFSFIAICSGVFIKINRLTISFFRTGID